jgi:hypothetical protein
MPTKMRRVLMVGASVPSVRGTVELLARHGWDCRSLDRLSEARVALEAHDYEIVLADEEISDGRGYDLTDSVVLKGSSLLVGVKTSDGFLWLPAVEHGVKTLGNRAVNPMMLELEVEELLKARSTITIGEFVDGLYAQAAQPGPKPGFRLRRKTAGVQ